MVRGAERRAAREARKRLDEDSPIVIGSSDGEDDDFGEEEASEEEEAVAEQPALSSYEQQREATIAQNNAVLKSLGLAGSSIVSKATIGRTPPERPPAKAKASLGSAGKARAPARSRSPSVASAGSESETSAEDTRDSAANTERRAKRGGARATTGRAASSKPRARLSGFEDEQRTDAYFTMLCAGRGDSHELHPQQLHAMAKELRLDTKVFSPDKFELMVDCFDGDGKGWLSLADFRRIVTQLR